MFEWLLDAFILSIFIGSIYVLASLGLTLTLAVIKLPNFAHAEFLTMGAYVGVLVSSYFPENLFLMGLSAFVVCGIIAVIMYYTVYKPLMDRRVSIYTIILASFAVATLVRYTIFTWATAANLLQARPNFTIRVVGVIGTTQVTNVEEIAIPLALAISLAVGLFLTLTRTGTSMRAVASNFELARITGIRLSMVVSVMWMIAGGLAGLGGVFLGIYSSVTPVLGFNVLLQIFAVVIVAGLTNMGGTVIGGYIIGLAENAVIAILSHYFGVPFTYKPVLPFLMILLVLLFRPSGFTPNFLGAISRLINRVRQPAGETRRG